MTRRDMLLRLPGGIGAATLATLFDDRAAAADGLPHFPPKAKRVILLHMSGGPSQIDLFDYKPELRRRQGSELPGSVRMGQRITGMTSGQSSLPVASSMFPELCTHR
jgi:hypothetical protein